MGNCYVRPGNHPPIIRRTTWHQEKVNWINSPQTLWPEECVCSLDPQNAKDFQVTKQVRANCELLCHHEKDTIWFLAELSPKTEHGFTILTQSWKMQRTGVSSTKNIHCCPVMWQNPCFRILQCRRCHRDWLFPKTSNNPPGKVYDDQLWHTHCKILLKSHGGIPQGIMALTRQYASAHLHKFWSIQPSNLVSQFSLTLLFSRSCRTDFSCFLISGKNFKERSFKLTMMSMAAGGYMRVGRNNNLILVLKSSRMKIVRIANISVYLSDSRFFQFIIII